MSSIVPVLMGSAHQDLSSVVLPTLLRPSSTVTCNLRLKTHVTQDVEPP
jgi:hypothetical protein